jgi:hypothetical protein
MRPAHEKVCGKQTPSASTFFLYTNLLYIPFIYESAVYSLRAMADFEKDSPQLRPGKK